VAYRQREVRIEVVRFYECCPLSQSGPMCTVIHALVEHRADLNARDNDGKTLVERTLARGLTDFADMLRARGATSRS
jgi:hypothetical protein